MCPIRPFRYAERILVRRILVLVDRDRVIRPAPGLSGGGAPRSHYRSSLSPRVGLQIGGEFSGDDAYPHQQERKHRRGEEHHAHAHQREGHDARENCQGTT